VALVADEDDVAARLDLTLGLTVDFGHQRACGVEPFQPARVGRRRNRLGARRG
jgi:hypothetical protein